MAITQTSRILTLDYWKFASDITVGDIVFDRKGNPVRVKVVQNYRAPRCFEVTFIDGLTIAGDDHLILPLEDEKYRNRARQYKGKYKFRRPTKDIKLSDLYNLPLYGRENRKIYSVPTGMPIQLPHQTLPVPPFVFGFWFFNRKANDIMHAIPGTADLVYEKFIDAGYAVIEKGKHRNGANYFTTHPTVLSHLVPLVPTSIPNNYLLSSIEQREELLSGILHSKHKNLDPNRTHHRFSSFQKRIASQVQMLAESLGYKTKMDQHPQDGYYRVLIYGKDRPHAKFRKEWRLVTQIKEITPQSCVHIETDGEDGSILVGEGFIPCL
jgi:hypothetical protein